MGPIQLLTWIIARACDPPGFLLPPNHPLQETY